MHRLPASARPPAADAQAAESLLTAQRSSLREHSFLWGLLVMYLCLILNQPCAST